MKWKKGRDSTYKLMNFLPKLDYKLYLAVLFEQNWSNNFVSLLILSVIYLFRIDNPMNLFEFKVTRLRKQVGRCFVPFDGRNANWILHLDLGMAISMAVMPIKIKKKIFITSFSFTRPPLCQNWYDCLFSLSIGWWCGSLVFDLWVSFDIRPKRGQLLRFGNYQSF